MTATAAMMSPGDDDDIDGDDDSDDNDVDDDDDSSDYFPLERRPSASLTPKQDSLAEDREQGRPEAAPGLHRRVR